MHTTTIQFYSLVVGLYVGVDVGVSVHREVCMSIPPVHTLAATKSLNIHIKEFVMTQTKKPVPQEKQFDIAIKTVMDVKKAYRLLKGKEEAAIRTNKEVLEEDATKMMVFHEYNRMRKARGLKSISINKFNANGFNWMHSIIFNSTQVFNYRCANNTTTVAPIGDESLSYVEKLNRKAKSVRHYSAPMPENADAGKFYSLKHMYLPQVITVTQLPDAKSKRDNTNWTGTKLSELSPEQQSVFLSLEVVQYINSVIPHEDRWSDRKGGELNRDRVVTFEVFTRSVDGVLKTSLKANISLLELLLINELMKEEEGEEKGAAKFDELFATKPWINGVILGSRAFRDFKQFDLLEHYALDEQVSSHLSKDEVEKTVEEVVDAKTFKILEDKGITEEDIILAAHDQYVQGGFNAARIHAGLKRLALKGFLADTGLEMLSQASDKQMIDYKKRLELVDALAGHEEKVAVAKYAKYAIKQTVDAIVNGDDKVVQHVLDAAETARRKADEIAEMNDKIEGFDMDLIRVEREQSKDNKTIFTAFNKPIILTNANTRRDVKSTWHRVDKFNNLAVAVDPLALRASGNEKASSVKDVYVRAPRKFIFNRHNHVYEAQRVAIKHAKKDLGDVIAQRIRVERKIETIEFKIVEYNKDMKVVEELLSAKDGELNFDNKMAAEIITERSDAPSERELTSLTKLEVELKHLKGLELVWREWITGLNYQFNELRTEARGINKGKTIKVATNKSKEIDAIKASMRNIRKDWDELDVIGKKLLDAQRANIKRYEGGVTLVRNHQERPVFSTNHKMVRTSDEWKTFIREFNEGYEAGLEDFIAKNWKESIEQGKKKAKKSKKYAKGWAEIEKKIKDQEAENQKDCDDRGVVFRMFGHQE